MYLSQRTDSDSIVSAFETGIIRQMLEVDRNCRIKNLFSNLRGSALNLVDRSQ